MSILASILVIISKNPIVSVLFLIGLFLGLSCYLLMLGLNFIGLSYLLIFIGAVSILFLFFSKSFFLYKFTRPHYIEDAINLTARDILSLQDTSTTQIYIRDKQNHITFIHKEKLQLRFQPIPWSSTYIGHLFHQSDIN